MNNKTTTDPQLTQINLFYKKDFYQKASNFLGTIQGYSSELETAINFNKSKVQNDPITAQADFFANLDNQMKSMQPQFASYWINAFNTSLDQVRNEVRTKIGDGTFFKPFSDSIGSIARAENYFDDSTQLISDIQGSQMMTPLRYGSSLTNKIHPATLLLHGEMSKKTNLVFRKNLQNIQSKVSSSTKAHGDNLVPDTEHFKRMQGIVSTLNQKIQSEYKELYSVIDFYCKYNPRAATNNLQYVPNYNITVNVEGNPINQDILFNQLQDIQSTLTTKKVLGVG